MLGWNGRDFLKTHVGIVSLGNATESLTIYLQEKWRATPLNSHFTYHIGYFPSSRHWCNRFLYYSGRYIGEHIHMYMYMYIYIYILLIWHADQLSSSSSAWIDARAGVSLQPSGGPQLQGQKDVRPPSGSLTLQRAPQYVRPGSRKIFAP